MQFLGPAISQTIQQRIGTIALVVDDYDDAIAFYTQKLAFDLVEDKDLGGGKPWVPVASSTSSGAKLRIGGARSPQQKQGVGNQAGGRVFLFLQTNDFWRDYQQMKAKGVQFNEEPREETYGLVVVFEDLYGNKWDLLQLKN